MPIAISRHALALLLAGAAALPIAVPASAQTSARQPYDLPAQALGTSLRAVAAASGRNILAQTMTVENVTAPALKGSYTADEAVAALLAGSGLRARKNSDGLIVERAPTTASDEPATDIIVSGTRIRGAAVASPVIKLGREEIKSRGQATLPDALRTLPQNFGGGQNPGVGQNVPEGNGYNVGGGSSINLRGLGSDATLTLLDGHRLSYNAAKQSVDISAIPLGAVSRLDIIPDGASALFGSDAVAGVVNILLRRDLNGLETGFRIAGTSDGGGFSQIYSATAGKTWSGGSALLAYEYSDGAPIISNQRDYAAIRPNLTIFPGLRQHAVLATVRQALGAGLTFTLDGLADERWSASTFPLNVAGDLSVSRATSSTKAQSWGLAPSLRLALAGDWELSLLGSYGQDKVNYGAVVGFGTATFDAGSGYYRNRERSVELSGNGPLFHLPGGPARLAVGAGYRRIDFIRFTGVGGAQNIDRSQADLYGFGELSLPVTTVVTLSAAARYENYTSAESVATPKFGVIVAPNADLSIKASWGKSFRAPTLYQQYQPQTLLLYDVSSVGGAGYTAGSTALELVGGNAAVQPERSTNWSATLDLHPRTLPGFGVELSYFSVNYRDRIVTPIPTDSVALASPIYASRVLANPSAAAQAALLARVGTFLNLSSNAAYVPSSVVAIIDNSNVNAGRQTVRGIDVLAHYNGSAGPGQLSSSIDLAFITSQQQLSRGEPVTRLAGTIFNPPRFRARGDLGWTVGPLGLNAALTYLGPVDDNRTSTVKRVRGMAPVDIGARYRATSGPLNGLDLILGVQNVFNAKPAQIATSLYIDTPYDSTNYSPVGRLFTFSVSKKW